MAGHDRRIGDPREIKRRLLSLPSLVSAVLVAAFLVFLVTRFDIDLGNTWGQVKGANGWLLAAAFGVHYTAFILRGARWRLLLENTQEPEKPPPGTLYCGQLVLLGWFVNAVTWFRMGDAYRAYVYHDEQKASFASTVGTILAERTLEAVLIAALLLIAVPFLVGPGGSAAWTLLAFAVTGVALMASVVSLMTWARSWAQRRLPGWLAEGYRNLHHGTLASFRRLAPVTGLGLLAWTAEVGRLYLVVQALGLDVGIPLVIVLTMANSLLSLVPTPGRLRRGGAGSGRAGGAAVPVDGRRGPGDGGGRPGHYLPEHNRAGSGGVPGASGHPATGGGDPTWPVSKGLRKHRAYALHSQLLRSAGLEGPMLPGIQSASPGPADAVGGCAVPVPGAAIAAGLPEGRPGLSPPCRWNTGRGWMQRTANRSSSKSGC